MGSSPPAPSPPENAAEPEEGNGEGERDVGQGLPVLEFLSLQEWLSTASPSDTAKAREMMVSCSEEGLSTGLTGLLEVGLDNGLPLWFRPIGDGDVGTREVMAMLTMASDEDNVLLGVWATCAIGQERLMKDATWYFVDCGSLREVPQVCCEGGMVALVMRPEFLRVRFYTRCDEESTGVLREGFESVREGMRKLMGRNSGRLSSSCWATTKGRHGRQGSNGVGGLEESMESFLDATLGLAMPAVVPYEIGKEMGAEELLKKFVEGEVALEAALQRGREWTEVACTQVVGGSSDEMLDGQAMMTRREEVQRTYPGR